MSYQSLGDRILVRISVPSIAAVTLAFPFGAFIICVLWSIKFDFESATATHCKVPNYLPSISAAIGGFTPQKYIWRIGIAFHAAPRFLAALCYYHHYLIRLASTDKSWSFIIRISFLLNVIENLSLIGLTYVASSENYPVHEKFFVAFMICSEFYMLLNCYLSHISRSHSPTSMELKSIWWKKVLAATNIAAFFCAIYFFWRHNSHCEAGMYTKFALCEYIVVLSNMGYHITAYWDFYTKELTIGSIADKLS